MGNYKNIEHDFIDRTMQLITQYENLYNQFPFEQQYNYTLLLNCLLGIIVMPKERLFSHIPNHRITKKLKTEMGLIYSEINQDYNDLRELIQALRHSIAHFSFSIISADDKFLIDRIEFRTGEQYGDLLIASFQSIELLPFLRYYADWTKSNLLQARHIKIKTNGRKSGTGKK